MIFSCVVQCSLLEVFVWMYVCSGGGGGGMVSGGLSVSECVGWGGGTLLWGGMHVRVLLASS